ncbi:substrate-specific activator of APC-dependent proteolysis [Saccharomyces cerevisiae]|uniref:APC/C activator protein CDH1 n=4 Tax=Saccharomyces cerevisiae TaxID=4932 RepID=CDH1_YEAST|nr:Cdh1p [Saccharomyces cerevisiae S288C]P53197.1 RecName: Full=APC/C activator protein CDH1; AltName: Full=CDC20 homolog 1; AltName: Full=Homolog of CDC twenty 1 [Saccharomyces cerevisiae S288C]8A3T_B Chain B, CDH1 isoform 1 [Saccharomyces cerevisiae]AJR77103.1 Cdh1p [Saccharomyces cerevisiae YJM195]AJR79585.1 Cdh1p [Saccharomyces cerevisiae YJM320]AJR82542.1 Cdh1p [Saccharomyces cerevisiae YJM456]AJR83534.1 Cdh1p [Saccharomyces cerevisiae YJM541]AJR93431.1 Cdh1p [Saccharomyces cerevisiae Y|eukprot:NP_011512.1 Cdh1p [Saccharomyces cerevisiae S288C]
MSTNLNPFMNNTPSSSPLKGSESKRVSKRPISSSSSASLLSSPSRRSRPSTVYGDRYIPSRTDIDFNSIVSISSMASVPALNPSSTEDQVEYQKERQAHETYNTLLKNELFGEMLSKDTVGSESSIDRIKNTRPSTRGNVHAENTTRHGYELERVSTPPPEAAGLEEFSPHSTPVTPRRLFTSQQDEITRPSSNSVRGASLLTYQQRKGRRLSAASLLQSQFFDSMSPVRPDSKQLLLSPGKQFRQIAKVPYRVLDAPSLADDFYYSLIDWSSTDVLAVALGKSIFLTDNNTGDVVHLCDTENEYTSLSWIGAGSHLAVGQANGLVEIYDVMKRKCIRTLSGHIDRVACLSWNNHVLTSGSRDHRILHRDVRMPDPFFETIESHTQEVCGLKWNVADNKLASGGNDNVVHVYEGTSKSPILTFDEHKAAVKAMAWSPHKRGVLATGGGTADRRLKIWNVNTSIKMSDIDSGSQICNMVWSKNTNELVTSHGYSKYNLTLWDCNSMDPIAILKGHSFRVLHLTLSNDGTTVVSGAGDETLRYWKLFDKPKAKVQPNSLIFDAFNQIR